MTSPVVKQFAELLVHVVRDKAIGNCDKRLLPGSNSRIAKYWAEVAETGDFKTISDVLVPDCIDEAIFCLLSSIDEGLLNISFRGSDGQTIDLAKEGRREMAGWYVGADNWRGDYSQERFNNYFD